MSERMDLLTARKVGDKTYFTRVGVAFKNKSGNGWMLSFEALPIPQLDENGRLETRVLMMEPKPRDGDAKPARKSAMNAPADFSDLGGGDDDSSIPF